MATNDSPDEQDEQDVPEAKPDDVEYASQDEYVEKTTETTDVFAPEGESWFEVREVKPLRLIKAIKKYNVGSLLSDDQDFDMDRVLAEDDIQFIEFVEQVIAPQVDQPIVTWDEETDDGSAEFYLADIEEPDLIALMAGMLGKDPEDMEDLAERSESFR